MIPSPFLPETEDQPHPHTNKYIYNSKYSRIDHIMIDTSWLNSVNVFMPLAWEVLNPQTLQLIWLK